ncbi:MAG: GNAT family N-acetyltransferase [Polyangiales bacterium]
MSRSYDALFALRVRTPRLELRAPTDDDLDALLAVARAGVHDPAVMPFVVPWTDLTGSAFDEGFMGYYQHARETWSPERWSLPLAVVVEGAAVGVQSVGAVRFSERRTVDTGSWLGRAYQGRGLGAEMRRAVLHLAFEGLGALFAETGALEGNAASLRVTERLGYAPHGERVVSPRGAPVRERRFRLEREGWLRVRRDDISLVGLEACAGLFGA